MDVNKAFKLCSVSKKEELARIVALPSDFVPVSRPSKRIENLLTKRKNDHDTAVLLMQDGLRETNLAIAEEMRREFAVLNDRLEQMDGELEMVINTEIKDEAIDGAFLTKEVFRKTIGKTHKTTFQKIKAVEEFYRNLLGLEDMRADEFAMVLKTCYAAMHTIYYKLPYDLQVYFEHEIMKLNQTTLANRRCYEKIRFHFKSQIQHTFKKRIYEIKACEKHAERIWRKTELKSILTFRMSSLPRIEDFLGAIGKVGSGVNTDNLTFITADFSEQSEVVDLWTSQTHKTLDFLENNAKKLVDLFKDAVVLVFNRFFEELQDLSEAAAANTSMLNENIEMVELTKELCDPLMHNFVETYGCDMKELKTLWSATISYMELKIVETHGFLNSCMHLFDDHFSRIQLLQTLLLKDLNNVIQKNDWNTQVSEKKINKTIDQLRQESTEENLDKLLKDATQLLDSIAKTYSVQCQKEIKVIGKYMPFVELEIDLVIAEMDRFLHDNKNNEKDPTIQRKRGSQVSLNEEEERKANLIPTQMKQCQYQVDCIFNWMFGLWEGVKLYLEECRQDMRNKAHNWAEKQIQKIEKRLEVKMAVHKPRYHRIRLVIYNKRLEEINAHLAKLEFLEEAGSKEFETARDFNLTQRDRNISVINTYITHVDKIEEKMRKVQNVHQIQAYLHTLNVRTKEALATLATHGRESSSSCGEAQHRIEAGILSFLRSIKLFGEGGNYNAAELAEVKKRMTALTRAVPKKFTPITAEAHHDTTMACEEVRRIDGLMRNKLVQSEEEFQHNAWTIAKIRQLKNAIHRQVYDAKCKLRHVEAYTEAFKTAILKNTLVGPEANYKPASTNLQEAVDEVDKLMRYLLRPNLANFKSNKAHHHQDMIEDYIDVLLNVIPLAEDGSYASKLTALIYESLKEVQEQTKTFYEQHVNIVNEGRIQGNFNAFMDEVMGTYLSYQLQCEYNWLECLNHLIRHNLDVLHFVVCTSDKTIKDYCQNKLDQFKNVCRQMRKCVAEEKQTFCDRYDRIKVNTECYLDDIENVLDKIHGDAKKQIEDMLIVPYKEKLERAFKEVQEETKKVQRNFQKLTEDELLQNYTTTLLDEFKNGIELIDNLLEIPLVDLGDDKEVVSGNSVGDTQHHNSMVVETAQKVTLFKDWFDSLPDEESRIIKQCELVLFVKGNYKQFLHEHNKTLAEFDKATAWIDRMHREYKHLFMENSPHEG